jgi:hypothetical protein
MTPPVTPNPLHCREPDGSDSTSTSKRVTKVAWIIAYLVSPAAPFVCLRMERAISTVHCTLGLLVGLGVQVGLVSVLAQTNDDPLQFFIVLLLATSVYMVVSWQYIVGRSAALWSREAERQWRFAARFFGAALAVGLAVGIASFHIHRFTTRAESGSPAIRSQEVEPRTGATLLPLDSGH